MKSLYSLLAASALATVAAPVTLSAMPPASAWEIGPNIRGRNYSVGMPAAPSPAQSGGLAFDFPQQGEIDALTTSVGPLAGAREITMRYRIDAASGTRLVSAETPNQTATVSLYIQRAGDNWSAKGRYASYRWYVPGHAVIPLKPGTHTLTVRFEETWTNVYGRPNAEDVAGYAAAMENTARLGIAFGTASARSHGVYATGPARFTLLGLDIK